MSEETAVKELASEKQLATWTERFGVYRMRPTKDVLMHWLERFDPADLPIAHKLLDAVVIVSELEIHQGYKAALEGLPGWSKSSKNRQGRWYFVGAGSAGESGPAMLRLFREANSLQHEGWQPLFVTAKDLPGLNLSAYDHCVFVDDFAGTGKQMVDYWPLMQELVASEAKCYLLLTAVTSCAADVIQKNTDLELRSFLTLGPDANVFADESDLFSEEERAALDKYGKRAWKSHPRGFGSCGLALVLSHKTPNNSLPILHANHENWIGPFPRTLIAGASS
ncbi:phosphoribosyltransferase-like protein [Rhizobium leguminosarum]|uniref:phosphoribosyltransferase-like protein n=1 Tax=Rhizobium leguminosarum TaxID=384 RepID=UPI001C9489E7|nr:hypothetical protein [Rhizobium leguminosarum]MBY5516211.1 hypothetical protein [Rhizobium leguminosarum]